LKPDHLTKDIPVGAFLDYLRFDWLHVLKVLSNTPHFCMYSGSPHAMRPEPLDFFGTAMA
jgi:hypothetical protein